MRQDINPQKPTKSNRVHVGRGRDWFVFTYLPVCKVVVSKDEGQEALHHEMK